MRKSFAALAAALAVLAAPAFATEPTPARVKAGAPLHIPSDHTLRVYRVARSGEPQVIVDGRIVTVPAATLSSTKGWLATSLSLAELRRLARH